MLSPHQQVCTNAMQQSTMAYGLVPSAWKATISHGRAPNTWTGISREGYVNLCKHPRKNSSRLHILTRSKRLCATAQTRERASNTHRNKKNPITTRLSSPAPSSSSLVISSVAGYRHYRHIHEHMHIIAELQVIEATIIYTNISTA